MKRTAGQHVMIDRGYGTAEYWVRARVIRSRMCADLFDPDRKSEQLLVEIPGGERIWVAFWKSENIHRDRK
jgi:hypothetical protein